MATARAAYRLSGHENRPARSWGFAIPIDERIARAPQGVPKQVLAVAQAILPAPPVPGIVGTREDVRNRDVVDSASGIVWVLGAVARRGAGILRRRLPPRYLELLQRQRRCRARPCHHAVGVQEGRRRLQAHGDRQDPDQRRDRLADLPVSSRCRESDQVAAGYFFGFYTGDSAGKPNAGVVEFGDDPQHQMLILTLDGGMGDQKLLVGQGYREQSHWPRAYSIQAVSKRK